MQQHDATKDIQKQLIANQNSADVFTKKLQRRNDNQDLLMEQPSFQSDFPIHFSPKAIGDDIVFRPDETLGEVPDIPGTTTPAKLIDLNRGLSSVDMYNLLEMNMDAPSDVLTKNTADDMLKKIKTFHRSIGQCL